MSTQATELTVKKSLAILAVIMLTLTLLLSVVTPVMAREDRAEQGRNGSTAPVQGQGPTDPAELEAFLD